ncbi:hypothetical protein GPECTOR_164g149 [Gonium pectorale]|uniref:Uncharacterized protein n=1 Tax=Gonium pectorale TaxID=33097 RepID=A0A150FXK3_GONPE|nr:hypothetical protein GPECTOR_164g149 [Gonium pectorale]|eukprot:KXZ42307.1 hypothetical protein GPECTOR_164g149 [Gonium pectorale]
MLPSGQLLHHVATANDLAQVLRAFCGSGVDEALLAATQLRLSGNAHAAAGEWSQALECYSAGLALGAPGASHLLLANRSAVRLQIGDLEGALADARAAVEQAPKGFHMAVVRLIDALYAQGRFEEAARAAREAVAADSSFAFRPEYPSIRRALRSAGQEV